MLQYTEHRFAGCALGLSIIAHSNIHGIKGIACNVGPAVVIRIRVAKTNLLDKRLGLVFIGGLSPYSLSLAYLFIASIMDEFVAETTDEKKRIANFIDAIITHII